MQSAEVEFRRYTTERIDDLVANMAQLHATLAERPTRSEIEHDMENLVRDNLPAAVFKSEHGALAERVTRLEGSTQRWLPWLSLGLGCLSVIGSFALGLTSVILFIVFRNN